MRLKKRWKEAFRRRKLGRGWGKKKKAFEEFCTKIKKEGGRERDICSSRLRRRRRRH